MVDREHPEANCQCRRTADKTFFAQCNHWILLLQTAVLLSNQPESGKQQQGTLLENEQITGRSRFRSHSLAHSV